MSLRPEGGFGRSSLFRSALSSFSLSRSPISGWSLLAVLALLLGVQLHAFHWGVITPDTVFQWKQALTGQYDDWHPPATTWLWRQLTMFGPGTAPVLIFQCLLYWGGVGLIADTLRRRGDGVAMAAVLLCAALPICFGQMGAILKDPLLGACCLFAAALLFAFRDTRWRIGAGSVAVVVLIFASATRFNAAFATAPLLAAWLPDRWLSRIWRAALCWIGCGLLLGGAGWAIDNPILRPHHSQPIYSQVNFDLGGIVAQGGGNAYPHMDAAMARRVTASCYDPGQYNPTYRADCDQVEIALATHVARHRLNPMAIWLKAIAASPLAYARHRLAHLNRNWRFLVGDVPNDAVYVMTTDNPFGIGFAENDTTRWVARGARIMALSPLGRPVTWIAVAVGLLIAGGRGQRQGRDRRFVIAAAFSTLCYGLGYAIFSVAPDMRYHFWTMIGAMIALVVAARDCREDSVERRRLWLAMAPAMLVALAEMGALLLG